ncbi:phosphatase PAP2 family protein [Brochothrix campestris]|uniref:phosphatase PAP2 family protein n=1 Tax=Brochothrix campestris TaxID=2757 RepID=UPI0038D1617F
MLTKKQTILRYSVVAIIFILFLFVAAAVSANALWVKQFDSTIRTMCQAVQPVGLTKVITLATDFAGVKGMIVITAIIVIIMACYRQFLWACWLGVNMLVGASGINWVFKSLFQRERPVNMLIEQGGFSFPSGHTMAITTFTLSIVFMLTVNQRYHRKTYLIITACLISFIGYTRIYLGVHYPSDIIGGFLLASTYMIVSTTLFRQFGPRIQKLFIEKGLNDRFVFSKDYAYTPPDTME